jgi:Na+(H+)/acetate symporter ActP
MLAAFHFTPALGMFLAFVALTLVITYFSARKATGSAAYFAAGRSIKGWQNGLAVAGDYMSAASFLGICGMIAFYGYDAALPQQSAAVTGGIRLAVSVYCAIPFLLGVALLFLYEIDKALESRIERELDARRLQAAALGS